MKTMKTVFAVAAMILATSSVSLAQQPECNHRVSSSGNDLFKNTNPPDTKKYAASAPSRPTPAKVGNASSGVQ